MQAWVAPDGVATSRGGCGSADSGLSAIDLRTPLGDEAMTMTKLLLVSILALLLIGIHGVPLQAQNAMQGPGMDMKDMKPKMEQMRTQMEQIQTMMKDNMAKMAAADAAMKSHMETEKANMKSQMELQEATMN